MLEDMWIIADFVSITISLGSAYCLKFGQNKSSREAERENSWVLCDYVVFILIKHLCIEFRNVSDLEIIDNCTLAKCDIV